MEIEGRGRGGMGRGGVAGGKKWKCKVEAFRRLVRRELQLSLPSSTRNGVLAINTLVPTLAYTWSLSQIARTWNQNHKFYFPTLIYNYTMSSKVPVYSTNGLSAPRSTPSFNTSTRFIANSPYNRTKLTRSICTDLKSTTDDALLPYLCTLPAPYAFKVDHSKSNIRFALGYGAIAIAGFTFYADRTLGWEATSSPWIIAAVVAYFTLNSILTFWLWAVEAGEVFAGKRRTGETVRVPPFLYLWKPMLDSIAYENFLNRLPFLHLQRNSRNNTSCACSTSLPQERYYRISGARLLSPRGFPAKVYFTPSHSVAGCRARLIS